MKKNIYLLIVLLGCLIFLNSCRTELEAENIQQTNSKIVTQSILKVKDTQLFKNFIQTHKYSFNTKVEGKLTNSFISLINDDNLVTEIKNEDRITYSFYNYNEDRSFDILVYVYNTKDKTDFSFISKFTPKYQDKNLTIIDFTGQIDYIDSEGALIKTTYRNEGKAIEGLNNKKTSTITSKLSCDWSLVETPHQCTEGGSHWPWEVCAGNANTLPYWEIGFEYLCSETFPKAQIADVGLSGGGGSGSGGNSVYVMSSYDAINYMFNQIGLENLTTSQYNYLKNNLTVSNYFRDFLFEKTNINNSNFVKWAIDYLQANSNLLSNPNWKYLLKTQYPASIYLDSSLNNSKTLCIINKITGNSQINPSQITFNSNVNNNDLVQKMLRTFNGISAPNLTFHIKNNLSNNDWGQTKSGNYLNNYNIYINSTIENSSNIAKIITIIHEMVHAYMFYYLSQSGFINFDSNGDPNVSTKCYTNVNYNQFINLNNLTNEERFLVLFCAMEQNNQLTIDWTHDFFNSPTINSEIYRQKIEEYFTNNYNWDNENDSFKNKAINLFGTNWKKEVSKAISWIGLEQTAEYDSYINSYPPNSGQKFYHVSIKNEIQLSKNECQ